MKLGTSQRAAGLWASLRASFQFTKAPHGAGCHGPRDVRRRAVTEYEPPQPDGWDSRVLDKMYAEHGPINRPAVGKGEQLASVAGHGLSPSSARDNANT